MKKKYLMYAGIISAAILAIMFIGILLTGSFTIFSSATIDPIPDHAAGDPVVITGTTNLMAGTVMALDIIAVTQAPGTTFPAGRTNAFIVRGGGMANTWSGVLDTSAMSPGEYQVNAYWVNETVRSDLLATSRLRLLDAKPAASPGTGAVTTGTVPPDVTAAGIPGPAPAGSDRGQCGSITIDPFPNRWTNNTYTITGTTRFPPGTELLVRIFPTEYDLTMNPGIKHMASSMSGAMAKVTVEKGTMDSNIWSVTIGKAQMEPGKQNWLVNVSNDGYDNRTFEPIYGDSFCAQRLLLPG